MMLSLRLSLVFVPTIKKTRRRPQTRRTDMSLSAVTPTARNISERASSQLESRAKNLRGRRLSARCIKHLRHLAHLASSGKPSCLLLVVNRGDCKQFRPCFEACPMFAREFDKAVAAGVRIVAAGVTWNEHGDSYFTKLLPILSNDQKEF